ncbi:MAG: YceI family protein [Thermomicrobiales bacterium]
MMFGRRRTRRQLVISLLTGVGLVTVLAVMVGTLTTNQLIVGTLAMTALGLIGIWFFDSGPEWSWPSDIADYLTIVRDDRVLGRIPEEHPELGHRGDLLLGIGDTGAPRPPRPPDLIPTRRFRTRPALRRTCHAFSPFSDRNEEETTRLAIHHLTIDPTHSTIEFAVTYAMNTIIKGRFHEYEGRITLDTNPAESTVSVTIRSESLGTGADDRDEHLKGDEFFAVETHDDSIREHVHRRRWEQSLERSWRSLGDRGYPRRHTRQPASTALSRTHSANTRAGFVGETDITRSDWEWTGTPSRTPAYS